MQDLISRQDAIEAVAELASSMSVCISVDECHGMKRMQGMAVRALDDLPSVQPQSTMGQVTDAVQSTKDSISRQAAIDALMEILDRPNHAEFLYTDEICEALQNLPSAQPEPSTGVQDILQYLDEYLHPIVSPEHWSVYSELYDMVSMLPSSQPQQRWIPCDKGEPNEDMECWVTFKTTDTLYRGNFTKRYGERRDKGFITSGGFMWWNTALAWMPIYKPEPYKGEQDE